MKKSLVSIAMFALMTAGLAHADTTTVTPQHTDRFNLTCSFPSTGCSADARILLDTKTAMDADIGVTQPAWFGNLLAVSCAGAGGLISASDATLYRLTGDPHFRWDIDNADATVHVLLEDHPFDGTPNPKTVNAELRVDHSSSTGTCTITRAH